MKQPPLILAIDDDPGRYDELQRITYGRVRIYVACCEQCVAERLPECAAVLLDHDITGEPCTCGEWSTTDDTRPHLPAIAARGVPVIVTSCSDPDNRRALTAALLRGGGHVLQHSANEIQPEMHWLGWLWLQGVL